MDDKRAIARQAIAARLFSIEAALLDLLPEHFGIQSRKTIESDSVLQMRYLNRAMTVFLLLYHLRDDACRLAKRQGQPPSVVDGFVSHSLPVTLCVRAGDTWKHGVGGRSRNATIGNGLVVVYKTRKDTAATPEDEAIVIGAALVDAEYGVFHSQVVIDQSVRDWCEFLAEKLNVDLPQSIRHLAAREQRETIRLPRDGASSVPEGALLSFEFPRGLSSRMIDDVRDRLDAT